MSSFFNSGLRAPKSTVVVDEKLKPWVERYRPKTIDEISAQEHTVAVLKKTLGCANLPHMLFYGPPGTGKTSTILALARQLFGPDLMRSRVLELNASDERGITVVREKIKNFAKEHPRAGDGSGEYPVPPFKIVILDEADSMTQDAQSALRRTMETFSRTTRFCLVCNYVTRIIEPVASRCSKFRFRPLDTSSTRVRIEEIAAKEGVQYEAGVLDKLISTSDGDLRRAIMYLQSASRVHGSTATPVSVASIEEIAGVVPDAVIAKLARACGVEEDGAAIMQDANAFGAARGAVRNVMLAGYSSTQLLSQFHDHVVMHEHLTAKQKSLAAMAIAEADKALTDGADEELQVLNLCLRVKAAVQA